MPEEWTGDIVKLMHLCNISAKDFAEELGVTCAYVSMVLHSKRNPKGAQERFESALERIIERKGIV